MTYLLTHRKLPVWLAVSVMLLAQRSVFAESNSEFTKGLTRITKVITERESYGDEILLIVPILSVISCVFFLTLYAMGMIRKKTMWQWVIVISLAAFAVSTVSQPPAQNVVEHVEPPPAQ